MRCRRWHISRLCDAVDPSIHRSFTISPSQKAVDASPHTIRTRTMHQPRIEHPLIASTKQRQKDRPTYYLSYSVPSEHNLDPNHQTPPSHIFILHSAFFIHTRIASHGFSGSPEYLKHNIHSSLSIPKIWESGNISLANLFGHLGSFLDCN